MDKWFHTTLYNGCNYLSMLGLKLIQVSKRAPWGLVQIISHSFYVHIWWLIFIFLTSLFSLILNPLCIWYWKKKLHKYQVARFDGRINKTSPVAYHDFSLVFTSYLQTEIKGKKYLCSNNKSTGPSQHNDTDFLLVWEFPLWRYGGLTAILSL